MSENDSQRLVERMRQHAASPMISSDTGVEAAQQEAFKLPGGLPLDE